MAAVRRRRDEPPTPTFVFKGSVKKLGSAAMKHVAADRRTAIVRVDQVVEANPQLARLAGQDVTVQLSGRAKAGDQLIFHTIPLMFGDTVSVRAVKQERVTAAHVAMAAAADPVARKAARDLRDRFANADVVVSGRVTAVTLPAGHAARRSGIAMSSARPASAGRPASEHDPKWRDAIVEVDAVHKGKPAKRSITVRFPESTDVRWYRAPKFRPGQQGFFMLQKGTSESAPNAKGAVGRARAFDAPARSGPVYTALHPADFQPFTEADGVRMTMMAPGSKTATHDA